MRDQPKKLRKKRVPRMIDWYRVDASSRVRRVLAAAAGLVLVGSLLGAVCAALMRDPRGDALGRGAQDPGLRALVAGPAEADESRAHEALAVGLLALALVVGGGGTAIVGLMRELSREQWIALRSDGLVLANAGRQKRARWEQIEDVRTEGSTLVVALANGHSWVIRDRFAGTTRKKLGERIAHVRRRALHGLLRRP